MNNGTSFLTARGLERRLKRHLLKTHQLFLAITTPGFEALLRKELEQIPDVTIEQQIGGGIEFSGPIDLVYTTNLRLRTANRVLMRIDSFVARSYPELFNKSRKISWELFCGFTRQVSFSVSSKSSRLHHTEHITGAVFDGMKEVMARLGSKMELVTTSPIRFFIRFVDDFCTVSIDTSGDLLYKRGFRINTAFAPIRETTAAALLLSMGWERFDRIIDPLCGSGTFALEAASLALNRAPGTLRSFSFFHWPLFNAEKWERIKTQIVHQQQVASRVQISATDINAAAITAARENAQRAGLADSISFFISDFFDLAGDRVVGNRGLLIANLPYGKRVAAEGMELQVFYKKFGEHLRRAFNGWHFGVVVADQHFERVSRLRVEKELRFSNGGIPVRFLSGIA